MREEGQEQEHAPLQSNIRNYVHAAAPKRKDKEHPDASVESAVLASARQAHSAELEKRDAYHAKAMQQLCAEVAAKEEEHEHLMTSLAQVEEEHEDMMTAMQEKEEDYQQLVHEHDELKGKLEQAVQLLDDASHHHHRLAAEVTELVGKEKNARKLASAAAASAAAAVAQLGLQMARYAITMAEHQTELHAKDTEHKQAIIEVTKDIEKGHQQKPAEQNQDRSWAGTRSNLRDDQQPFLFDPLASLLADKGAVSAGLWFL
jgi:hypothetical protein